MKTSIELNEAKLEQARKLGGSPSTLKELIDQALDAYITQKRRDGMFDILGTDFFEPDLDSKKMRERHARPTRR